MQEEKINPPTNLLAGLNTERQNSQFGFCFNDNKIQIFSFKVVQV